MLRREVIAMVVGLCVIGSLGAQPPAAGPNAGGPLQEGLATPPPEPEPVLASTDLQVNAMIVDTERLVQFRGPDLAGYTWLLGNSGDRMGVFDIDFAAMWKIKFLEDQPPLYIRPGFSFHFWQGPGSDFQPGRPDLPDQTYDTLIDFSWQPRLAEFLFLDLAVTPGWYGDYEPQSLDTFRLRGRSVAIVALSEELQLVGGAIYINRNSIKVLPACGILWKPTSELKMQLVFPAPKIAYRLQQLDWRDPADTGEETVPTNSDTWIYVAGEFGGGAWAIQRANGLKDSVDYNDWRVLFGIEHFSVDGTRSFFEFGYVFSRKLDYVSATPDYEPENTFVLRAGTCF